jgi:hypothetical protein
MIKAKGARVMLLIISLFSGQKAFLNSFILPFDFYFFL